MNPLSPITRAIIFGNVAVFLVQMLFGNIVEYRFALWPWGTPLFHAWQIVTYAFLHGGFAHLFFNMFGLYMFGPEIERVLGPRRFLIFYFTSVVGAAALHLLVQSLMSPEQMVPTLGASGGVFGVLLAFGMMFPKRRLMLLIPPIPMPAWLFVTLYGLLELVSGVFGTNQGVAHFAHLGGMLAAFLLLEYWRLQRRT